MRDEHERTMRECLALGVYDEQTGEEIGTATWRAELGKWDCKGKHFGIRAWASTFARAESTVRRLVERKKGHTKQ